MRVPLCLVGALVIAVFVGTTGLGAAKPKASPKPSVPEKKAVEATSADSPATHKVKRELFKTELSLKGVFEAEKTTEIVLRPEVWMNLEVAKVVEHGQTVKRGDLLLECDLDKIDEDIADSRAKVAITELSLKQAEESVRTLETTTPMDLKLTERSQQYAQEDLARYLKLDRPLTEENGQFHGQIGGELRGVPTGRTPPIGKDVQGRRPERGNRRDHPQAAA